MDEWTLSRLEERGDGDARAVFEGEIDGARMRVELDLVADLLAQEGAPSPFVTTAVRVSHAGIGRKLGWRGITSTLFRKIPVAGLTESAGREMNERLKGRGLVQERSSEELRNLAKRGPKDDELLRLVGQLYTEALVGSTSPARDIAEKLGLSQATATRWIRRSRDRGYIAALRSEIGREGSEQ